MEHDIRLPYFILFTFLSWLPWTWLVTTRNFSKKNQRFYITSCLNAPLLWLIIWSLGAGTTGQIIATIAVLAISIHNISFITYCEQCGIFCYGYNYKKFGHRCEACLRRANTKQSAV